MNHHRIAPLLIGLAVLHVVRPMVVQVGNSTTGVAATLTVQPVAGTWTQVEVPLAALGVSRQIDYVYRFNNTAGAQPAFYLDDVAFVASGVPTPTPAPPGVGPALNPTWQPSCAKRTYP